MPVSGDFTNCIVLLWRHHMVTVQFVWHSLILRLKKNASLSLGLSKQTCPSSPVTLSQMTELESFLERLCCLPCLELHFIKSKRKASGPGWWESRPVVAELRILWQLTCFQDRIVESQCGKQRCGSLTNGGTSLRLARLASGDFSWGPNSCSV